MSRQQGAAHGMGCGTKGWRAAVQWVQHLYMFFVWQSNWSFLVNKPTVRSGVCTESVPTVRDGILGQAPGILRDEALLQWGWRVLSPLVPPGCRRNFGGMRKVSVSPSLPLSGYPLSGYPHLQASSAPTVPTSRYPQLWCRDPQPLSPPSLLHFPLISGPGHGDTR